MSLSSEMRDTDHYRVLGVQRSASAKEILKFYRKQALKCHPDKNPDNPAAVKLFHQLSRSLELLSDPAARAAYDKFLDGQAAAAARVEKMDGERKKFREDLEAKERAALSKGSSTARSTTTASSYEALKRELDRLREEGSEIVRQEQERFKRRMREEAEARRRPADTVRVPPATHCAGAYNVKLKWKATKTDAENGGYSASMLEDLLSQYGEVNVALLPQKKGSAMAEFSTFIAAMTAMEREKGLSSNPLQFTLITNPAAEPEPVAPTIAGVKRKFDGEEDTIPPLNLGRNDTDFESVVMMRMRQAEERKRLEKQMLEEDD